MTTTQLTQQDRGVIADAAMRHVPGFPPAAQTFILVVAEFRKGGERPEADPVEAAIVRAFVREHGRLYQGGTDRVRNRLNEAISVHKTTAFKATAQASTKHAMMKLRPAAKVVAA